MKKIIITLMLVCALIFTMTGGAYAPSNEETAEVFGAAYGTIEDDAYINEYFGLGFAPPEEWEFYTDEELAEMMNLTIAVMEDEDLKEMMRESMEDSGSVTNMAARKGVGTQNLNMRLMKNENAMLLQFDEEDILKEIVGTVEEQLTAAGYKDLKLKVGEIEFAGEAKPALFITGSFYNIPVYQAEILLMGEEYYAIVTFTSLQEDQLEEQYEYWYVLDAEEEAEEAAS